MSTKNSSSRDRASRLRQITIYFLAAMLSLAGALPVLADGPPEPPPYFKGIVTLDGSYAPDGTVVSAWINGVMYAETTTTTPAPGENFAGQPFYQIDVPPDDPDTPGTQGGVEGDTIVFQIGSLNADQTAIWHVREGTELNLTATNQAPSVETVTPSSGSCTPGSTQSFTTTYSDPNGWQDIKLTYFSIGTSSADPSGFRAYLNQNNNCVYLYDPSSESWIGGLPIGSEATIDIDSVTLNLSAMSASGTGDTLSTVWSVTFKGPSAGAKNTYLKASDQGNSTTLWTQAGTWTIDSQPPSVGTATPDSGSCSPGTTQSFSVTYSDPDGWQNLKLVLFSIGTSPQDPSGFRAYLNQNNNRVYLYDPSLKDWIGGQTISSEATIETHSVALNLSSMSISGTGDTSSLIWSVTFKGPSAGTKNTYLKAWDQGDAKAPWTQVGTWAIDSLPPSVGTITPDSGSCSPGDTQSFIATYSDPDGWQNIKLAYFSIGASPADPSGFRAYMNQNNDRIYIYDSSSGKWIGGHTIGSENTIDIGSVALNLSSMSASGTSDTLSMTWSVTFKEPSVGAKNSYLKVCDQGNTATPWIQSGTWTVNPIP